MKRFLRFLIAPLITIPFVALLILFSAISAHAIVIRHDVPDSRYFVSSQATPALVDLPSEGHGTLIETRWVLTAAHAVTYMKARPADWYVTINGKRRTVTRIILYPDYEKMSAGWKKLFEQIKSGDAAEWEKRYDDAMSSMHDIALLELSEPVNDVPAMAIYRGAAEAGQIAEVYGAGATGTDINGAPDSAPHRGTLRRAENRVTSASGSWLRYVFDCGEAALPLEGVAAGGDSGGPLLIKVNDKSALVGIVHGLDVSLEDVLHIRDGDFHLGVCGQTFASTRVSFYARWIDETIRGASN